jgi:hypothetical protein
MAEKKNASFIRIIPNKTGKTYILIEEEMQNYRSLQLIVL